MRFLKKKKKSHGIGDSSWQSSINATVAAVSTKENSKQWQQKQINNMLKRMGVLIFRSERNHEAKESSSFNLRL